MSCKCGSERIAEVNGKTSDRCFVSVGNAESGYVPRDMNIGGGDYLRFSYCLDCGQMQGNFPLPTTLLETESKCPCCGEPLQDDICQNTECES